MDAFDGIIVARRSALLSIRSPDVSERPRLTTEGPTMFHSYDGMPAASTMRQSILLAQLMILRRLEAARNATEQS
jgi:hypothetical protein